MAKIKLSLFLMNSLFIALFILFSSCNSPRTPKERLSKDNNIHIQIISKKDTSTIKIKVDSLYSTLNKLLKERTSSKGFIEKLSENTGYIADTSGDVQAIWKIFVSLFVFILATFPMLIPIKVKKFIANSKQRLSAEHKSDVVESTPRPILKILRAIVIIVSFGSLLWFFGLAVGWALSLIVSFLKLLGYAILIAPLYWYVSIQYQKLKIEKSNNDALTAREEFTSEVSKLEKEKLELEIKKLNFEINEIERANATSPFTKRNSDKERKP